MRNYILFALLFVFLFSSPIFAVGGDLGGSGQDGSADYPYLIEDLADFQAFCNDANYWASGVYTQLTADVDLGTVGIYSQAPIAGDNTAYYAGNFDGKGHVISNLTVDGGYYSGLFGRTDPNSSVIGLGIENASVTGSGYYAGGLVGSNNGSITSSYSTGGVYGNYGVGGLSGGNFGSITSSYSTGKVYGFYAVGGLVGWNNFGSISSSYSTGVVNGSFVVGGLVGCNSFGSTTSSYSTGAVNGNSRVGGLVGENNSGGSITSSFWDMQTSLMTIGVGDGVTTGATGKTTFEMQTEKTFTDAGWDFINTWGIIERQTYSYLRKYSAADISNDGIVNFIDLAIIADNWLAGI